LTVHQIPTNSERAILKDEKFHEYVDVLFSPDGSYIYFRAVTQGTDPPDRTDLYRIPLLGGSPERVLETVDATPTFIDGGQRLCFLRVNDAAGTLQFLSASADGGDEHVLASIKASFPPEAACDPSGKRAVIEDELRKVYTLDFASGSEKLLISMEAIGGYMTDIRWRPDGGGLFAISRRGPTFEGQLSFLSYPGGALRQITNDPNSYAGTSLTANAKIIATRQTTLNARFEILSLADPSHLEEHGPEGLRHFSWLDNKTIVASDAASTLRRMDLANDDTTPLNPAKGHWFLQPVACGPDTLISMGGPLDKGAMQIYRMNYDGSHATALTAGPYDVYPACTPDGKWLFYENGQDPAKPVLTRLSLRAGGGAAQTVAVGTRPSLSIDGKFLVNVRRGTPPHIEIYSTESLKKLQSIQLPSDFFSGIAFSADDKSIFYPTMTGPDTTLWKQQLDGAAAVKVANLPGKTLQSIRLSPDGTKLGMILETPQSEAVLLREVQ
jgi:dipeptidyl aminopeptidase/acylaminoacyl peptidase